MTPKFAAKITAKLKPHQSRVIERLKLETQPGLVVAHGLGSGKTLSSIAAQEALNLPANIVVPAALQENYLKEVAKHTRGDPAKRTLVTLQRVARGNTPLEDPMLVVDEAHRIRAPGSKSLQHLKKSKAEKRMLLTASPFYNSPSDIAPLVNFVAGEKVLPVKKTEFLSKYVQDEKVSPGFFGRLRGVKPGLVQKLNPATKKELGAALNKWVDYHASSSEGFPSVEREDVRVPMGKEQLKVYDTLMGAAPAWVSYKVKKGLPPSKSESKDLNAFLSAARQASLSTAPFQPKEDPQEAKIDAAFDKMRTNLAENPRSKGVVYSNFLQSGIEPYSKRLSAAGISHGKFTGELKKKDRDQLVKDYNTGKIRALLLSSAGGEGLDLKGTRLIQVLEPHWNTEKLKQVEGRGIRFGSHTHLPKGERKVKIQRFLATRSRKGFLENMRLKGPGGSTDEYLADLSAEKEKLIRQFRGLLEKQGALQDVDRGDRAKEMKRILNKHLDASRYPGVKEVKIHTKPSWFGIGAPKASILAFDAKGKSIFKEDGGFSFGTADISSRKKLFRPIYEVEADAMYLKDEHKRKGVGGAMFRDLMGASKELGASKVTIQAEEDGKAVWAKMPGVQFQKHEKRQVSRAYARWRKKNGGPTLPKGAPPKSYPSEFLKQWSPDEFLGFIGYEIPTKSKLSSDVRTPLERQSMDIEAFTDELEKIGIDPVSMAAMAAGAKILGHNAITRHGMKFKPFRRMTSEIIGAGARAGAAGKPQLSRPLREFLSLVTDPHMVSALERGHQVGTRLGPSRLQHAKKLALHPELSKTLGPNVADVIRNVPLKANTRARKALDYGFTPVRQVGKDIKDLLSRNVKAPAST